MRALAVAVLCLSFPAAAGAQASLGRALADPAEGALVLLRSTSDDDRVTVTGPDASPRACETPCSVRLGDGRWRLRFDTGPEGPIDIDDRVPRLVLGRALDPVELGLGVAALVIGAVGLTVVFATLDEACWRTDGTCSPDYGPLALGVGVMGVAIGTALLFDSAGGISITNLPSLHRR